jgi:Ni2+-binding GTPase involved in maturation of urease and hydrogenase
MARARYVMVGGFLGAGKTTAMLRFGQHLALADVRVGLVTNDQSSGLADTTILSAAGFPVEEITGGCFCCRFNSLTDAADRLTERAAPDVFLAEPVGSCTDLKATVAYPLRRMYGDEFSVAPLSVLLDPVRALRVLGLEGGRRFSQKVHYVYGKQLEEADVLVVNKIDTIDADRRATLRAALTDRYPHAAVFEVSAKTGEHVLGSTDAGIANLEIDYDEYATGESLLGWLNATARLAGPAFDGNAWVEGLVSSLQERLRAHDVEIAHLKCTLTPGGTDNDLCVVNAVGSDSGSATPFRLQEPVTDAELIVNLRAEGDPELLKQEALAALTAQAAAARLSAAVNHVEHFRPGRPVPTHRDVLV